MKYKTKKTLKTLALSVLGIGALVGVASGINTLAEKQDTDLKTIYPTFEVGGLKTEDGKYEESKGTIYTKDAFECQGLEITLDFDNTIKYQVFYYENDGDFISSTDVLLGNQDLVVPLTASHARLEITPNWAEMGEDYKDTKNQEVKWYEVLKYSSQIEVKVNKEQKSIDNVYLYKGHGRYESGIWNENAESPYYYSEYINLENSSTLKVYVPNDIDLEDLKLNFYLPNSNTKTELTASNIDTNITYNILTFDVEEFEKMCLYSETINIGNYEIVAELR